jgi:hypothetical protein
MVQLLIKLRSLNDATASALLINVHIKLREGDLDTGRIEIPPNRLIKLGLDKPAVPWIFDPDTDFAIHRTMIPSTSSTSPDLMVLSVLSMIPAT